MAGKKGGFCWSLVVVFAAMTLFSPADREKILEPFFFFFFFFFLSQKLRLLLSSGLLLFLLSLETFNPRHFHTARGICHHQPTYSHAHLLTYKPLKQMNKHSSSASTKTPAKICKHYLHNHTHASVNPNTLWDWSLGYSYLACNYTQFFSRLLFYASYIYATYNCIK